MPKRRRKDRVAEEERPVEQESRAYAGGWNFGREVFLAFWKDGERYVDKIPHDWFFYVRAAESEKIRREIERRARFLETTKDGAYLRVFYNFEERWEIVDWLEEKGVEPLEADVTPFDRFMAENEIPFDQNPRVLFFDLETDSSQGGWDEIEKHRILSIAYRQIGEESSEWICAETADDEGERKLLDQFLDIVERHDILVSWNGDVYDEPVLRARCKRHHLRPGWHMIRWLDMLALFKKYYGRDAEGEGVRVSFALENIAQTVLGYGKIPDVPKHKMLEVWKDNRDLLARYNVRDVDIMVDLEDRLGYIGTHSILSNLCNRFLSSKTLKQSHVTDGFVLRYGAQNGIHFKTKRHDDLPEKEKIKGAHVEEPMRGLHEGVCDLDFSSLYPNIVMAFNISPEVRVELEDADPDCPPGHTPQIDASKFAIAENGAIFRTETEGVFPAISRIAVEARQGFAELARRLEKEGQEGTIHHKRALQTSLVYKILANAFYGALSSIYSRYYDPQCGAAITMTGRACIQRIMELAREKGIPVVYGDTDSSFLKCLLAIAEEFIEAAAEDLDKYATDRGAKAGGFRLKVDAEFVRIFFTRKKKYAGKKTTGKTDVRGLELIRSDGCKLAREMQRRFIEFLLEAERPSPQIAEKLVRKWAVKVFAGQVEVDDLKMAETLAQPIENYKVEPIHVRIAKELLSSGREVYVQMKIPYVLTGKDEGGRIKAVYVDDFDGNYDAVQYWREQVFPPTKRILDAVFPDDDKTWLQLEKWNPAEAQKDLFSKGATLDGVPVRFRLRDDDKDRFQKLRDEMEASPGKRPVEIELEVEGDVFEMTTELQVRLTPDLVKALERESGHRVYYGPEIWCS